MRRFAVPAAVTAVAVVVLAVLAFGISHSGANNSIAYSVASKEYKVPPDDHVPLPGLDNTVERRLSQERGHFVLVNFFASWCVQCQLESGVLARAQKVMAAHGGTVLGVTFQTPPDQAAGYIRTYRVNYPVVSDPAGNLAGAWGISGVPDSYLIDPQGRIVWLNVYELSPSFVSTTLPQLLQRFA